MKLSVCGECKLFVCTTNVTLNSVFKNKVSSKLRTITAMVPQMILKSLQSLRFVLNRVQIKYVLQIK